MGAGNWLKNKAANVFGMSQRVGLHDISGHIDRRRDGNLMGGMFTSKFCSQTLTKYFINSSTRRIYNVGIFSLCPPVLSLFDSLAGYSHLIG